MSRGRPHNESFEFKSPLLPHPDRRADISTRSGKEVRGSDNELEFLVKELTFKLAESNKALILELDNRRIAENEHIDLLGRLVAGQESERRRIALGVHDQLGQRLTAMRLTIASLNLSVEGNEEISSKVRIVQEFAEELDTEVSFLEWELRPTALDDLGLVSALGEFVHEWSKRFRVAADFHSTGFLTERPGSEASLHLYRITQEALNNVKKHANASNVSVLLEKQRDNINLIIEDDGSGFDTERSRKSGESVGLGLIGLQERANLLGGTLEIESAPGKGAAIFVRIPRRPP